GSSTSCTATVSGGVSPSGSVSFTTSGSGSVTPAAASCTLTSGSCSVSFTGVTSGSVTVNANYGGDPSNVGSFGTTQISVAVGLVAPTISANPTTIDSGQGSTLVTITSFSGGIPSYTCQWLVEGPGSSSYSSLGSSFACNAGETPSTTTGALFSTGTWSFELEVTDSSTPAVTVASNAATVLVNPALTAGAITPTNPTIDSGQSITLTANPTGGVLQYSYQWYTSPSCAGPGIHGQTSSSYTASPSSTTTYYYLVTDSSGSSACSPGDTVTVNPALTSPTISANSTTLLPGQTSYLVSTPVSTGTSPYTYQWLVESPFSPTFVPITGATSSSYYFVTSSSTQTGTWSFELQVTDATGASVISNTVLVTVS
ncbi:MAG: hypothetical protein PXY39_13370, partial [archaeon]|nr:hypothetical protein [archaeon]